MTRRQLTALLCSAALAAAHPVSASMLLDGVGGPALAVSCGFTHQDFTTATLPAGDTFTRASGKTIVNSSGVLTTITTNVFPWNYDINYPGGNAAPAVGAGSMLQYEYAATNIALESNTFSNASWVTNNSTVTSGAGIGPDGTNDLWNLTTSAFFSQIIQGFGSPPASGNYVMSLWAKAGASSTGMFLQAGGVTSGTFVPGATTERFVQALAAANFGSGNNVQIFNSGAPSTNLIYGAQLEAAQSVGWGATNASSLIQTTTATVTRAADQLTITQPGGCAHIVVTFGDNTTQIIAEAPGAFVLPTNLNEVNIKGIDGTT